MAEVIMMMIKDNSSIKINDTEDDRKYNHDGDDNGIDNDISNNNF